MEKKHRTLCKFTIEESIVKKMMDGYLSFYFKGQDSFEKILLNLRKRQTAYLRYVVGGNILSYDGKKDR